MHPTQENSSSSSRQRDNGARSGKTLTPKRSVDDIFSSSTFFSAASSYKPTLRKKPSIAPVARAMHPDNSIRSPERKQKLSETSSRQPTQNKFQWMKGELIGRGSHGKVYLGFNVTTGELLAVKQVEIPTTADDRRKADSEPHKNFVRLLREERETLKDLYHPNIVQYLGFEENLETVNIFLEYVSGGTIAGSLQEHGPFEEEVTKSFTRQILEGLSYLHSKGIIHRDLKSDNILISDSGICKISDFGISKKLEKSRTHTFQGTYNWMAPEMVTNAGRDNAGYDSKVDIWSVGCIVLEMWTAKRPWHNENAFIVMIELNKRHVPPLPAGLVLSTLADNFNKRCFELNPAERPTASNLLKHSYLTPKAGWSFPGMDDIGTTKSGIIAEVEEMAEVLSQSFELDSSKISNRASSPALTMKSGTLETPSIPTPNPPRSISPPLVYIAPPPPRKLSSTQDIDTRSSTTRDRSTSNASASSGNQESGRLQRKLGIHNPATIPDLTVLKKRDLPKLPKPEPFIYHPPPLPDITAPTPYSNQLGPQTKYIHPSAASLSLPTKNHRMGPANLKDIMSQPQSINSNRTYHTDGGSYTTSSGTSSSLWQKPPPNVVSRSHSEPYRALSGKFTPNAPFRKLPPIPIQRSEPAASTTGPKRSPVFTGNARPNSRNVLEHMKVYFPNYDLDEPVVSSQMDPTFASYPEMATDTVLTRRFTMKSIKIIAEEQIHRDCSSSDRRRQTMLWDGHIEEIKAPR